MVSRLKIGQRVRDIRTGEVGELVGIRGTYCRVRFAGGTIRVVPMQKVKLPNWKPPKQRVDKPGGPINPELLAAFAAARKRTA